MPSSLPEPADLLDVGLGLRAELLRHFGRHVEIETILARAFLVFLALVGLLLLRCLVALLVVTVVLLLRLLLLRDPVLLPPARAGRAAVEGHRFLGGHLAHLTAGVTDLRCIVPNTADVHDVIAQLTAMVVGTVSVLTPSSARSRAPDPPEGWGGRSSGADRGLEE